VEQLLSLSTLRLLVLAALLTLHSPINWAAVGRVTEQNGPTEIIRDKKSIPSAVNTGVEMNDTVVTAKAKAKLTFEDSTTVNITEQSKLVIDDFVYDPKKGSGKLAMKVVMGTARYASGQIAKTNPQSVNVQTPTATVAVRGTDFSMTVDELGRSLIMLLPSCDNKGCVTGAIQVSNDVGTVLLDVAFQSTFVSSRGMPPSAPVVVNVEPNNINNLLIVSPPKEIEEDKRVTEQKTALDVNFLNQDFLKFDDLNKNELESFRALDLNFLDSEMLGNMLDLSNAQLFASQETLSEQNSMLPGYSELTGLKYYIDAEVDKLVLYKFSTHNASVTLNKEADAIVTIIQDGVNITQKVNRGGTTTINIVQK
jgi:hypothetical protein